MLQTARVFVGMVNNTKLLKLHIFLSNICYKMNEKIVRKNAADFRASLCWMVTNVKIGFLTPGSYILKF